MSHIEASLVPAYSAYDSDYGIVMEVNGFVLGSLLAQPFFRKDWFQKHSGSLEVILKAEEIAQQTLKKSGPRSYSGLPSYGHIIMGMRKLTDKTITMDGPVNYGSTKRCDIQWEEG